MADEPEVTVEVNTPEPEETHDDSPDVVVVDTGDNDSGDDLELGIRVGHMEAAIQRIEERLGAVIVAEETHDEPDIAEVAEVVAEAVAEAVAEPEEEPEPEEDESPQRAPWTHRSFGELTGRRD